MEHAPTEPYSTPSKPAWPPTAVPGRPGHHTGQTATHGNQDAANPASAELPSGEAVPDPEPTAGSVLLDELRAQIARFVILPSPEALDAVTLWVAATHLQPAWQHAPRLAVVGPAKRCGKSRLLDVLTETVHEPMLTINTTPAAVFRSITEEPPTLLVDEADTIFGTPKQAEKNEEMRGLLNAGHHLALGDYPTAEYHAHRCLSALRPHMIRSRAIATTRLAHAQLAQGAADTATATAMKVPADVATHHARVARMLQEFGAALRATAPGSTTAQTWTEHAATWRTTA